MPNLSPEKKSLYRQRVLAAIHETAGDKPASKKAESKTAGLSVELKSLPIKKPVSKPVPPVKKQIEAIKIVSEAKTPRPAVKRVTVSPKKLVIISHIENKSTNKSKIQPFIKEKKPSEPIKTLVPVLPPKQKSDSVYKKMKSKWRFKELSIYKLVAILAVLSLVLILTIDVWGLYRFGFNDGFSYMVAKVAHLPAGRINGQNISLAEFIEDEKILKTALANDREGLTDAGYDLENQIFNRLAINKLIEIELARYGRKVANEEVENEMMGIIQQLGDYDQASSDIAGLYGLSIDQFKVKVLKPLMAKERLQALIVDDESLGINQEALVEAKQALRLALSEGVDFSVLANQYTDDEAGVNTGGDLGWVSRGELDGKLEDVLFSLPAGQVYGELVKNSNGYHILKAEEKLTDSETGKESVRARHILIKVDVDAYLESLILKSKIRKLVDF